MYRYTHLLPHTRLHIQTFVTKWKILVNFVDEKTLIIQNYKTCKLKELEPLL